MKTADLKQLSHLLTTAADTLSGYAQGAADELDSYPGDNEPATHDLLRYRYLIECADQLQLWTQARLWLQRRPRLPAPALPPERSQAA